MSAEPTAADRDRARDAALWHDEDDRIEAVAAAIAAAREEGRQEMRAAVEALATELKRESFSNRYIAAVASTKSHTADRIRAAVAPAQPAETCYCDSDLVPVPHAEHLPAQPVTRTTPEEQTDA